MTIGWQGTNTHVQGRSRHRGHSSGLLCIVKRVDDGGGDRSATLCSFYKINLVDPCSRCYKSPTVTTGKDTKQPETQRHAVVRISGDHHAQLTQLQETTGFPRANHVRWALDEYLKPNRK